jgi:hypothetical protein
LALPSPWLPSFTWFSPRQHTMTRSGRSHRRRTSNVHVRGGKAFHLYPPLLCLVTGFPASLRLRPISSPEQGVTRKEALATAPEGLLVFDFQVTGPKGYVTFTEARRMVLWARWLVCWCLSDTDEVAFIKLAAWFICLLSFILTPSQPSSPPSYGHLFLLRIGESRFQSRRA